MFKKRGFRCVIKNIQYTVINTFWKIKQHILCFEKYKTFNRICSCFSSKLYNCSLIQHHKEKRCSVYSWKRGYMPFVRLIINIMFVFLSLFAVWKGTHMSTSDISQTLYLNSFKVSLFGTVVLPGLLATFRSLPESLILTTWLVKLSMHAVSEQQLSVWFHSPGRDANVKWMQIWQVGLVAMQFTLPKNFLFFSCLD